MPSRPPAASRLSTLLATLADAATRLPRGLAWLLTVGSLTAVAAADYLTGLEISLGTAYLAIACFAAWCLGERIGMMFGFGSVLLAGWINGFHSAFPMRGLGISDVAMIWNTCGRLLSTGMLVALAGGLRCALDQARWRASTDGLTGALNKATFANRMQTLVTLARQRDEALVVAYVDLDGFKAINDNMGHAAGDALLCRFADAAGEAIRGSDLFARVGGDEFMALLTVADCAQGDVAAERLHARLSEILRADGQGVTCSVGALIVEGTRVAHVDMLIDAADGLMYEVKRAGKDSIRIARDDLQQVSRMRPRRAVSSFLAEQAA